MASDESKFKIDHKTTHIGMGEMGSTGDQLLSIEKDFYIDFIHLATKKCVSFKGFVTAFDDAYQANWNSESVYGRMDPLMMYQGTERTISISWDVVAASLEESIANLHRIEHLMTTLYPVYSKSGPRQGPSVVQASPLMKIKFANLIRSAGAVGDTPFAGTGGLVAAVTGFNYAPDFEPGFYLPGKGRMFPKSVTMNCQFTVLHTHKLGWEGDRWRGKGKYPYGTDYINSKDPNQSLSKCPEGKGTSAPQHKLKNDKKGKKGAKPKQANRAAASITKASGDN